MSYNPVILALDYSDLSEAHNILDKVRPYIGMAKIGLELFTTHGRDALQLAKEFQIPIFLDLKLHDIPKTVEKTVGAICEMLAPYNSNHFLSVHCFGGTDMLKQALKVSQGSNVQMVGITLLTSLDHPDLYKFGFSEGRPNVKTIDLAWLGRSCISDKPEGLTHFVCAPTSLKLMRKHFGDQITLITPGIRADGDDVHDHQRTATASAAIKDGANWIVVGRPITQSGAPAEMALQIRERAIRWIKT